MRRIEEKSKSLRKFLSAGGLTAYFGVMSQNIT
jgi:hypothetical protein